MKLAHPELRTRLASQGREFVRAHFAVEHMVQQIHQLYRQLAAETAGLRQ